MKLSKLLQNVSVIECKNVDMDLEISSLAYHSAKVEQNGVFVCIKGYKTDRKRFCIDKDYIMRELMVDKFIELNEFKNNKIQIRIALLYTVRNRSRLLGIVVFISSHIMWRNIVSIASDTGNISTLQHFINACI